MSYLSIRKSDLKDLYHNREQLSYRSYQTIGSFLKAEGFAVGLMNASFDVLKENVIDAWESWYKGNFPNSTNEIGLVENASNSTPEPTEAPIDTEVLVDGLTDTIEDLDLEEIYYAAYSPLTREFALHYIETNEVAYYSRSQSDCRQWLQDYAA